MHGPVNVKSPNNTSKWRMGFNSAFKRLVRGKTSSTIRIRNQICSHVVFNFVQTNKVLHFLSCTFKGIAGSSGFTKPPKMAQEALQSLDLFSDVIVHVLTSPYARHIPDGTQQTANSQLFVSSGIKTCTPVQKKSVSSVCSQEVTACFTSASVANSQLDKFFLRGPQMHEKCWARDLDYNLPATVLSTAQQLRFSVCGPVILSSSRWTIRCHKP
jgi:hypothetical protein